MSGEDFRMHTFRATGREDRAAMEKLRRESSKKGDRDVSVYEKISAENSENDAFHIF